MVLENVPCDTRFIEIGAAPFHAQRLRNRDLDIVDIAMVPQQLEESVGKSQDQDVLDRLFTEIVVDTIDLSLGEAGAEVGIKRPRRVQVVAEWLFNNDT